MDLPRCWLDRSFRFLSNFVSSWSNQETDTLFLCSAQLIDLQMTFSAEDRPRCAAGVGGNRYDSEVYMLWAQIPKVSNGSKTGDDSGPLLQHHDSYTPLYCKMIYLRHDVFTSRWLLSARLFQSGSILYYFDQMFIFRCSFLCNPGSLVNILSLFWQPNLVVTCHLNPWSK
jgi:hypothetical protein